MRGAIKRALVNHSGPVSEKVGKRGTFNSARAREGKISNPVQQADSNVFRGIERNSLGGGLPHRGGLRSKAVPGDRRCPGGFPGRRNGNLPRGESPLGHFWSDTPGVGGKEVRRSRNLKPKIGQSSITGLTKKKSFP